MEIRPSTYLLILLSAILFVNVLLYIEVRDLDVRHRDAKQSAPTNASSPAGISITAKTGLRLLRERSLNKSISPTFRERSRMKLGPDYSEYIYPHLAAHEGTQQP